MDTQERLAELRRKRAQRNDKREELIVKKNGRLGSPAFAIADEWLKDLNVERIAGMFDLDEATVRRVIRTKRVQEYIAKRRLDLTDMLDTARIRLMETLAQDSFDKSLTAVERTEARKMLARHILPDAKKSVEITHNYVLEAPNKLEALDWAEQHKQIAPVIEEAEYEIEEET